jgi:hypothetical protein
MMASGFLPPGPERSSSEFLRSKIVTVEDLPVADESPSQLRSDGDAMHTGSILDFADDGTRIYVEHFDLGSVGNI